MQDICEEGLRGVKIGFSFEKVKEKSKWMEFRNKIKGIEKHKYNIVFTMIHPNTTLRNFYIPISMKLNQSEHSVLLSFNIEQINRIDDYAFEIMSFVFIALAKKYGGIIESGNGTNIKHSTKHTMEKDKELFHIFVDELSDKKIYRDLKRIKNKKYFLDKINVFPHREG